MELENAIAMDSDVLHEELVERRATVHAQLEKGEFEEVIENHPYRLTCVPLVSKKDREAGVLSNLNTALHTALLAGCSKEIVEKMLGCDGQVYLSLKNREGKTPYDIAKDRGMDAEVLHLLEPPKTVSDNLEVIASIEAALHKVILGRVENLIKENGVEMPQVAPFFEKPDRVGSFHYSVPGMYGGFNFTLDMEKCILAVESFCRVVGGSEETHIIDRNGKVKTSSMYKKRRCGCFPC